MSALEGIRFWERPDFDVERSPDVQLRVLLVAAKRRGENFWTAWGQALDRVEWGSRRAAVEWREVFEDPRIVEVWWAAYCDLPDPSTDTGRLEGSAPDGHRARVTAAELGPVMGRGTMWG